ncbi:glycoside hydrolase family 6 protein [Galbitalea sp. SE-J8]|uniref:glycoside hydrolase family 6 protein n=1 Tax=Galbitalea sp. SE-J8 TaxID=3054952 RepID=UPI00259CE8A6|nr:glycoside hydrolase family 6 protein [Galbitalea sp. SE-J8]MDM4763131.1 glycoside hydrolase family 6 protein [Galbitalea sp. SE-J8]
MAGRLSRRSVVAISVAAGLAFVAVVAFVFSVLVTPGIGDPFTGRALYVYPDSTAAKAAATASGGDRAAFERIAQTPTAVWLTPEQHGLDDVQEFVYELVTAAHDARALPVLVVYGIPDRDCGSAGGGFSAGGLTDADYPLWLDRIADGVAGYPAVIILEPDSLASAPACGATDERVRQISGAIDVLSARDTTIYLDGGHSSWLSADDQAALLERAGVRRVRGFASNVANYNSTDDELAYDERVASIVGGSHFVIDTGRNGNGSTGDWCNPPGRALGAAPGAADGSGGHDADLWIKNPGESDGTCNGGPAAGQWWPEMARELAAG